ncbi:DsbA family protein [Haladaptatus pallidirubidus]
MNRRTLLKATLPAGLLLAGCTSQSDESETTSPSQISTTATTTNTVSTIKTTRLQTQTPTTQRTESTIEPETTSTTQSTTEQEPTTTTPSTTEPETTTTAPSTTEQTTSTTQSTTEPTTSTTPSTTEQTTSTKRTTTTVAHSAPNHPSTKGIFDEPTRGPTPFSPDATLIAFEDPSCHNCVYFEEKTYPNLKRNHIDSGELSFVVRTIPVVEEWGTRAIYALEAAHARNEQAFWDLKAYYFSNQGQFNSRNVLSKTKSFIDYNTRLNGRVIVRDAKSKAYNKQVREDRSVAKTANVPGTPVFFAFRSEKYVTKIVGTQGYSIFKNVLGL